MSTVRLHMKVQQMRGLPTVELLRMIRDHEGALLHHWLFRLAQP